jgi:hypothetical protein
MSSTTKDKRIRRIERRAIPELVEAMRNGQISVRMADTLLLLPAEAQLAQLQRRLNEAAQRECKSQLAARTIREYLGRCERIDLEELQGCIREALLLSGVTQA